MEVMGWLWNKRRKSKGAKGKILEDIFLLSVSHHSKPYVLYVRGKGRVEVVSLRKLVVINVMILGRGARTEMNF